jgi:magnesium chelatase subunit D
LLVLLTDGRANAATRDCDPLADAMTRAAALRAARVPSLVVDTEQGALRLGLARRLTEALGGVCLRLEELAAGALARAVKLSLAGM